MEKTKICFLGDTQVGKTTFLAALRRSNSSKYHFDADFDDEYNTGLELESYAQSIENGTPMPSTSEVRHFRGKLQWSTSYSVPIEFIDIPGEVYHSGYTSSNGEFLKEMRPFINQCEYLYFFFEPSQLISGKNLFTSVIELLHDYNTQTGKKPYLSLVLTKSDQCPEYEGEEGESRLLEVMRSNFGDEVAAIKNYVQHTHWVTISSFAKNEGELGLSPEMFDNLFLPLKELQKASKRNKILCISGVVVTAVILLGCVRMCLYDNSEIAVQQGQKSFLGLADTHENRSIYVSKRLKEILSVQISYASYHKVLSDYFKLKDAYPDFRDKIIIEEKKHFVPFEQILIDDLERLKASILVQGTSNRNNNDEYEELSSIYKKCFGDLPDEVKLPWADITELEFINAIIDCIPSSSISSKEYCRNRLRLIDQYLYSQPASLTLDQREELDDAVSLAEGFCDLKKYTVEVEAEVEEDEYDLYCVLNVGENFTSCRSSKSGPFDYSKKLSTKIEFDWCLGDNIRCTLMDHDIVTSDDELAEIERYDSYNNFALSLFTSSQRRRVKNFDDKDKPEVWFEFILKRNDGMYVTPAELNLVYKYVMENDFWVSKQQQLNNRIHQ